MLHLKSSLIVLTRLSLVLLVAGAFGCSSRNDRGTVGESCQARSDCDLGLACVREVCVMTATDFSLTGKSCDAVQCATDADCCADFLPDPSCDVYDAACQANPLDCLAFRTLCQCTLQCQAERCFDVGPHCLSSSDCPSLLYPHCVTERCVECRDHADCAASDRCIEGACQAPCQTDEECPLLHGCQAGDCVLTGCQTDRECAFLLSDTRAVCETSGGCAIECAVDADCDFDRFEVCHNERCTFVGCETDEECRAFLDLEVDSALEAVCR